MQATDTITVIAGLTKSGKLIHLTTSYTNRSPDCVRNGMNSNKKVVYTLVKENSTLGSEWTSRVTLVEKLYDAGHTSNFCEVCFRGVGA